MSTGWSLWVMFLVVLMLTFVGIWVWAWRKRHREVFQRMADLPMEDAAEPTAGDDAGEQR